MGVQVGAEDAEDAVVDGGQPGGVGGVDRCGAGGEVGCGDAGDEEGCADVSGQSLGDGGGLGVGVGGVGGGGEDSGGVAGEVAFVPPGASSTRMRWAVSARSAWSASGRTGVRVSEEVPSSPPGERTPTMRRTRWCSGSRRARTAVRMVCGSLASSRASTTTVSNVGRVASHCCHVMIHSSSEGVALAVAGAGTCRAVHSWAMISWAVFPVASTAASTAPSGGCRFAGTL